MKRIIVTLATLFVSCAVLAGEAASYRIDHLEPPYWWAGMQSKHLQLMVHGERIAQLAPSLAYPGVRIGAIKRGPNPNYLFIDLALDARVKPGSFDIVFKRAGAAQARYTYQLRARAPGSRLRAGFSNADVIYEVMPDRYANGDSANDSVAGLAEAARRADGKGRHGGDIAGIINHLDYIATLGFTQLWPTPLVENNAPIGSYHGYAATDHYRIDARFGSNDDYLRLSAQARARGIGLIADVVLSHIGIKHWWMADLPMPDWINHGGKFVPTEHHRVAMQDPYGSREDRDNFTTGWFTENMPDLNQTNPYVANYLIENNIWWIESAGLSGLRIDTYSYSDPAFLSQYTRRILDEYPQLNLVGEEWSRLPPVVSHWQKGKRNANGYVGSVPSLMDFPLAEAMRAALAGDKTEGAAFGDVYETASLDYLYPDPAKLVLFEGNHDTARIFSVVHQDLDLYKMAIAYLLTMPRIPQIYAGTEVLMTSTTEGRDDASYRQDFPGGWPGDTVNAFTGAGLSAQQKEAQAFVRKLLNWRKGQIVIHSGRMMHYGAERGSYVYFRYDGKHKVMVAFNKAAEEAVLPTRRFHEMLAGIAQGTDVISGKRYALETELRLPARSVLILELQ
ncbi:MAG: glycoside hydrolase family 13 protein [Pseudomonadota bacterium]